MFFGENPSKNFFRIENKVCDKVESFVPAMPKHSLILGYRTKIHNSFKCRTNPNLVVRFVNSILRNILTQKFYVKNWRVFITLFESYGTFQNKSSQDKQI